MLRILESGDMSASTVKEQKKTYTDTDNNHCHATAAYLAYKDSHSRLSTVLEATNEKRDISAENQFNKTTKNNFIKDEMLQPQSSTNIDENRDISKNYEFSQTVEDNFQGFEAEISEELVSAKTSIVQFITGEETKEKITETFNDLQGTIEMRISNMIDQMANKENHIKKAVNSEEKMSPDRSVTRCNDKEQLSKPAASCNESITIHTHPDNIRNISGWNQKPDVPINTKADDFIFSGELCKFDNMDDLTSLPKRKLAEIHDENDYIGDSDDSADFSVLPGK